MIIVLFPGGSFGSTIEYSLRQFSNELTKVTATITNTGSMHSYDKEFHPLSFSEFLEIKNNNYEIVTPVYPNYEHQTPAETIKEFKKNIDSSQKVVLVYFSELKMSERNQLFCYYKIPDFLDHIMKDKQTGWNADYTSYKDMQPFELREALSFFIDQQAEQLEISKVIDKNWLCITPDDVLYNFKNTILKIIEYTGLTVDDSKDIDDFYNEWFKNQQYILDEFENINSIVASINSGSDTTWNKLSIIGEAMVQSRLRQQGIELACHNLDQFPSNTKDLKKVLLN
jgi:hypothetical protein